MKVARILGEEFDSNIYILIAERKAIIDTGTGFRIRKVLEGIEKYFPIQELEYIILTHMHFDHIGGAKKLKEHSNSNAKIYISEADGKYIIAKDGVAIRASGFFAKVPEMELNFLNEGDVIDLGDSKLEVISTPGHTIGRASLYEPEEKRLFPGDTVFSDGPGRFDIPTGNKADLIESIKKLSDIEISVIYPGHGDTIGGEPKYVRDFLKLIARSLE